MTIHNSGNIAAYDVDLMVVGYYSAEDMDVPTFMVNFVPPRERNIEFTATDEGFYGVYDHLYYSIVPQERKVTAEVLYHCRPKEPTVCLNTGICPEQITRKYIGSMRGSATGKLAFILVTLSRTLLFPLLVSNSILAKGERYVAKEAAHFRTILLMNSQTIGCTQSLQGVLVLQILMLRTGVNGAMFRSYVSIKGDTVFVRSALLQTGA